MGKGGGGSPQPQTTTAYQTNLPEYAKPYVENMLNAAQTQIYNNDMTSFRPYTPYSTDPTKYFAGPSSLQQSTYNEAAGMQTPGGYAPAQGLTGLAAMGQMGAGRQFERQATDPNAVSRYMSPYMQNVVDTQKLAAVRDYQMATPARQAQQTLRGAFGGSRSAIENAEAQRALMSQLQGIQAQGTQNAFQNAQAQQQFGANLGLQGLGAAAQSAGQLGQLAGAQQQSDIARMGLQNQLGAAQQQYQQGIINQAIQDYATAQQYPYMQLSTMSNLLRGLPMQAMTTQQYQAAPSAISTLGGLGATALGAYGMSGGFKAKGGTIKEKKMAIGGIASSGVANSIENQLYQKNVQELIQIAKTSPSKEIRQEAARIAAEKQMEERTQESLGLESAPAPNLDTFNAAGGGIVAFGFGGDVTDEERKKMMENPTIQNIDLFNRYWASQGMGQQSPEAKAIAENIAEVKKGLDQNYDNRIISQALIKGGSKAMQSDSPYWQKGIGAGIEAGTDEYAKGISHKEDLLNKIRSGEIDLAKLTSTERNNLLHYATTSATQDMANRLKIKELGQRGSEAADAKKSASLDSLYKDAYGKLIAGELKRRGLSFEGELSAEELNRISQDAARRAKDAYGYLHGSNTAGAGGGGANPADFDKKKS